MLIVHFRLNMLSLANASGHLGGCIDMHTHLITVILLDEIGTGFNRNNSPLINYIIIWVSLRDRTRTSTNPHDRTPMTLGIDTMGEHPRLGVNTVMVKGT